VGETVGVGVAVGVEVTVGVRVMVPVTINGVRLEVGKGGVPVVVTVPVTAGVAVDPGSGASIKAMTPMQ